MAIKIGKYYITQNNPRELLRERAELINVLDEIREYIENHKIEWIDEKFDKYNEMVKFNEYTNPQAILDILDKVKE